MYSHPGNLFYPSLWCVGDLSLSLTNGSSKIVLGTRFKTRVLYWFVEDQEDLNYFVLYKYFDTYMKIS